MAEAPSAPQEQQGVCMSRFRQTILVISLLMGLMISSLDTSIVSTSLITISHEFNNFVTAPWIVLAYLLTYMGLAVYISKLSDIYGRAAMLGVSWTIFMASSLGCGLIQDMNSLIVFRALQGIGASGLYSLAQIGLLEVGPRHSPSAIGAMVGATLAVAFVMGPLLGGILSDLSSWRWIFWINLPIGIIPLFSVTVLWPKEKSAHIFSLHALTRIDLVGGVTLLGGSCLLVFALQQGGSQTSAWHSPAVISAFVVSGLCWAVFIWWEVFLEKKTKSFRQIEPIFPIRLMLNRVYSAGLFVTLFTGFPYISLSILIPERFQILNGESALMAGVHLLPMLGACAFGSFLGGAISSKRNNTSLTLVGASALQLLGTCLMTMLPGPGSNNAAGYCYQAIFGLGVGLSFSSATIMTNVLGSVSGERASAQGAVAQARVLGGCIGLSICTVILNVNMDDALHGRLTQDQLARLRQTPLYVLQLPNNVKQEVMKVYNDGFSRAIMVMALLCAVMAVTSLATLERHPLSLERFTAPDKDGSASRRGSDSDTEINDLPSEPAAV